MYYVSMGLGKCKETGKLTVPISFRLSGWCGVLATELTAE